MISRTDNISQVSPENNMKSFRQKIDSDSSQDIKEENSKKSKSSEGKLSSEEYRIKLDEKINEMNNITETINENLSFKLHDDTERLMVQVINSQTKEVIKEMPPEEILDLAAKIHEMVGLIIDEKV